ncbi:glycosyltransferase family 1 protein [Salmonella enterica subsp. salamae]|uniref:Glycosyltransferase family 1 protein n=4 Tax=Salmonella enterica subsp. salamae TaxID=59202 RepID=A0A344R8K8_SALER|nr:glycosyltransferase family 1 protein [Salmonella enterica]EAA8842153.1 glycosyltransferase family 1 protein [Salmonella enterica subsp. enterica]EAA9929904.1 glycosyltransferase family 1 protein [Salmonella enterica subsp. salamae]EBI0477756.1 glycosyltransferase family 1 protein [Salmonella enterica subsp. enterica serovar Braenderup]ECI2498645.1 glycosyltransferase family 4 protein [Salmonella enterica subsp. enterica serovar Enteritidis]EIR0424793.1 glycosyltransferase family 4 protein [
MKIIFSTEPIKYPLTGIGRYSFELVKQLAVASEIEELKLFHGTTFIEQIPLSGNKGDNKKNNHHRLSAFLRRQPLLIDAYFMMHPRHQAWALRNYKDYIFHGPNFYLPYRLERAVATFHDISIFTCPEYHPQDRVRYMEKSLRESLSSAKLILTVSDFSRQEMIRMFNYPSERIITTTLACSSDYIPRRQMECQAVLQKYQLEWQCYGLYIGTLEPRKNIRGLLQAYQMLPMETRMRYPLILCGYHGWEDDTLWQIVEKSKREGWLRYLGYVPDNDLPYLYAAARSFIYPSFYEGFGLPVLEAMSCGIPVVSSNVSSLPEVAGDAGLLSEPNDIDAISAHILQSLQDEQWRKTAIARGFVQARQFSWENCAAQTINAYKLI